MRHNDIYGYSFSRLKHSKSNSIYWDRCF